MTFIPNHIKRELDRVIDKHIGGTKIEKPLSISIKAAMIIYNEILEELQVEGLAEPDNMEYVKTELGLI